MADPKARSTSTDAERALLDEPEQRTMRDAYMALIERTTLQVLPDGLTGEAGTGIAAKTRQGTPFVITVRHLFERRGEACPGLVLGNEKMDTVWDAGLRAIPGPPRLGFAGTKNESVDVAAVMLNRRGRFALRDIAGVMLGDDSSTDQTDVLAISGFPTYLGQPASPSDRLLHSKRVIYITRVNGRDQFKRLEVQWDEARVFPESASIPHSGEHGNTFNLGPPHGISGGGLWRFRMYVKNEIWATHFELIGLAGSVFGNEELCEPVELWRSWLDGIETTIDELL
jgi:hypothetical protein